jgi:hypothetical protein
MRKKIKNKLDVVNIIKNQTREIKIPAVKIFQDEREKKINITKEIDEEVDSYKKGEY